MLIIGNKTYNNFDFNEIIDSFGKNIRLNLGLPGNNNGTQTYIQYANIHVHHNIKNKGIHKYIEDGVSDKYINEFKKIFYSKNCDVCLIKQNNNNYILYNKYLTNISSPYIFNRIPRIGCNAIFEVLIKSNDVKELIEEKEKIYITHYSLSDVELKKHLYYGKNKKLSDCHSPERELLIIRWLHNNNYIDATLCAVQDSTLPLIDCQHIKPSNIITDKLLSKYGICILKNFYNKDHIDIILNEFDLIYKNNIEILDNESSNNDKKKINIERDSLKIKELFSDNVFLNNCATRLNKNLNKKTLINKICYEENKIKTSGTDWYRDNHDSHFKVVMYLTDITEDNGNIQFLSNSSKTHIDNPITQNNNIYYTHQTIETLIKTNNDLKIFNITGEKGTIVLINTIYINRENIIKAGNKKEIIQYF